VLAAAVVKILGLNDKRSGGLGGGWLQAARHQTY
jgi:hypothetical protein